MAAFSLGPGPPPGGRAFCLGEGREAPGSGSRGVPLGPREGLNSGAEGGGEEEENLARGQVAGCEEFLSHGRAASGLAKP